MFQRAFSVSTREPAALLFVAGGGSPTGVFVAWCNIGTFVRLCFGVSCDICAGAIVLTSRLAIAPGRHVVAVAMSSLAVAVVPGRRDVPGHGRRDAAVASLAVAVAWRGRGCGARRLFAAVVWLRHADEC